MTTSRRALLLLLGPSIGLTLATPAHAAGGGPDGGGYFYTNSTGAVAYDATPFTTALATATVLPETVSGTDDGCDTFALGFSFTYYGTAYTSMYACSNGILSPGVINTSYSNMELAANSGAMIAPFWDDLHTGNAGDVRYYTSGTAPNRTTTVVWNQVAHISVGATGDYISFAVRLYETSNNIVFFYNDVSFGSPSYNSGLSATAGIDGGGSQTQLGYNTAFLTASTAYTFTKAVNASASVSSSVAEGSPIAVSAAASTALLGSIASYSYDCTNDGTFEATATAASSYNCTYPDEGSYTARVRVNSSVTFDGPAGYADATTAVTVTNANPVLAGIASVTAGSETTPTSITAVTATDAGSGDTLTYNWRFTDSAGTVVAAPTTSTPTVSYQFPDDSTYNYSVFVTDGDGGTSGASNSSVTPSNVGPTISVATLPTTGNEGSSLAFSATAAAGLSDTLTYTWTFATVGGTTLSTATAPSVAYTFADNGSYTVTVAVTDGDGGSAATRSATVVISNVAPTLSAASVTLTGSETVATSFSATATDPGGASDPLTYNWTFGDGTTATTATSTTTHLYPDDTMYTWSVVVTDGDGGTSSARGGTVTPANVGPTLTTVTAPSTGTEGAAVSFSATATAGSSDTLTYTWTFTDSSGTALSPVTASAASGIASPVSKTFTNEGSYGWSVAVTDADGGTSATRSGTVVISNVAPTLSAASVTTIGSETTPTAFSATATDPGTTDILYYSWTFGDGTTATTTTSTTTHQYADDRAYGWSVVVADGSTSSAATSATRTGTVTPTNVGLTISSVTVPASGVEASSLTFSATATAGLSDTLTYTWTFGDGTTGTASAASGVAASVTHAYADNNSFAVSVSVTDDDSSTAATRSGTTVAVGNVAPTLSAAIVTDTGTTLTPTGFSASATDPAGSADPLSYAWTFGDGTTATTATATTSHQYATGTSYTWSVVVTDGDGGTSSTGGGSVLVGSVPPTITSAVFPSSGAEGASLSFSAAATAGPTDVFVFTWTFGDGTSETRTSATGGTVTHAYVDEGSGSYDVVLTVVGAGGASVTRRSTVTVTNAVPVVASASVTDVGSETSVSRFTSSASDVGSTDVLSYNWAFGDGTTATTATATTTHAYPDDRAYSWSLTVTDNDGGTSAPRTGTVTPVGVGPSLSASSFGSGSEGASLAFSAAATAGASDTLTYAWTFGDGATGTGSSTSHVYADNGAYAPVLTVTDDDGSIATTTGAVTVTNVAPTAEAIEWVSGFSSLAYGTSGSAETTTAVAYEGDTLALTASAADVLADTVSIGWAWGDGDTSTSASDAVVTHIFDDEGTYTLTVVATDEDGGSTDFSTALESYAYHSILNVAPDLTSASAVAGTESTATQFTAAATDPGVMDVLTYTWTFGDGTTSTGASATHAYADDGSYAWSLTVDDGDGGSDVASGTVVSADVAPTIGTFTIPTGDEGASLTFASAATAGTSDTLTYAWSFGDGSTSTDASPTHAYADDGAYAVSLTVTDDDGSTATRSGTVTVNNLAPSVAAMSATSGYEGATITYTAVATDSGTDTLSYAWNFGDGTTATTSTGTTTHVFTDNRTATVTVTVTDGDGGTTTRSAISTIRNLNPTAVTSGLPSTGAEGVSVAFTGAATDPGSADTFTYSWNWGDGTTSTGATPSHTWGAEGTYTVTMTVLDDDGGRSTGTRSITIANVAPVISAYTDPGTAEEGTPTAFVAAATDVSGDTLVYTWNFGDGTTASGDSVSHAWPDNGTYTIELTVEDGSARSRVSYPITVTNVDPLVTSITSADVGEGETQTLSVVGSDAGTADTLTYAWDFDDGTTGEGESVDHAWTDDGTYIVTVRVMDDDGGMSEDVVTVVVTNGAPTITSAASLSATEGAAYGYLPTATDPGADTFLWSLVSGPASMSVDSATGAVVWTPAYEDTFASASVTLRVEDGDGGADEQSWSITVMPLDTDEDGMTDGYELARGFDPYDAADGVTDPDADGIDNATEFADGTDPDVYDGPSAPASFAPVDSENVSVVQPDLIVDNATSPRGLELVYEYEVYEDVAMTILLAHGSDVAEGADQSTWTVDTALSDDTTAYWRARADDGYVSGAWTDLEAFHVNTAEDAPNVPVPFAPVDGDVVTTLTPDLVWVLSTDPDGTEVTYDVQVWDAGLTTVVTEAAGVADDAVDAYGQWTVDPSLAEDTTYYWTVQAVDADGVTSAWSDPEAFRVSTGNAAPSVVTWVAPLEGEELLEVSPVLSWTESVDPEGTTTTYRVEVDLDPGFATAVGWDVEGTSLDLAGAGEVLFENEVNVLRVRSTDGDGLHSAWSTVSVFVRGENDAPSVPDLTAPADGESTPDTTPTLTTSEAVDPEGDLVTYEIVVSANADLSEPVTAVQSLAAADGGVSWDIDGDLVPGTWYWSARAVDALGAAGAWAEPWSFVVEEPEDTGTVDTGVEDTGTVDTGVEDTGDVPDVVEEPKDEGCGCATGPDDGQRALTLLGVLGLVVAGRRRRS